jgi:hypothetical protein
MVQPAAERPRVTLSVQHQRYAVYGPGAEEPLVIDAENWVFALGTALELLEREDWVSRLACEVHPDGTVVAEDRVTGVRYLVHRIPLDGEPEGHRAHEARRDASPVEETRA